MAWYRKSAEQGNATAQNNIGMLYLNGKGVNKDHDQAKLWLQKAADQGDLTAKGNLSRISGWRRIFY